MVIIVIAVHSTLINIFNFQKTKKKQVNMIRIISRIFLDWTFLNSLGYCAYLGLVIYFGSLSIRNALHKSLTNPIEAIAKGQSLKEKTSSINCFEFSVA